MAYDRFDTRQGPRDDRGRWSEDRSRERSRDQERGFFERAGEEISSWFGGERDDRDRDFRGEHRGAGWRDIGRDERSGPSGNWRNDRDDDREGRGWFSKESYRGQGGDSGSSAGGGWPSGGTGGERGYRPMTGDYGRSEQFRGRGDDRFRERGRFDRPESNWDRDDYRRTEFAGSRDRSNHPDPHYHDWRQRQISELDRDYDEYRREHQQKFESDFGSWREKRQAKRQMVGQAREHMEVVGSDEQPVGTVDKIAGDRIILTKSDPAAGGIHHSIGCTMVDRIEGERIILDCTADEARKRWRDEERNRALFEREDSGETGPHMLDRSFSGTYRD